MHKVQLMTQIPTQCFYCMRGNVPDGEDTMDDFWAMDFERDFNWGDSTYLCKYCIALLASHCGYVTEGQLQEQVDIQNRLHQRIHDLEAELEAREVRLERIVAGSEELRAVKAEATKAPKKAAKKKVA